ncbi:MAG: PQQ-binding-like beta-propeller repeat protein [Anaerolineae bacterium]|nr:PQQ-binding-like beta-propeller repeat protein [Anaerolineae bacterium]
MKKIRYPTIFSLLALSLFLGGCGTLINPSSWPGLAVEGESVYIAYGSHVYALQLSNGAEQWRFPEEAENSLSFYSAPVLDGDGSLYFGSYSQSASNGNNIYKVDQKNGNETWHFDGASNRYIASALVVDGALYAPNADSILYKLSTDGQWLEDWSFQGEEPLWAQPQIDEGVLYLTGMDHHVYAIEESSGEVIWITEDLSSAIASTPLIGDDGNIYIGTFGSQVLAIDKDTGTTQWTAEMDDWVWGTPAILDGNLYIGDQSGTFMVLDSESGEQLWSLQADGGIIGTPLVIDERVYFGTEAGKIYRIETTESGDWDFSIIHTVEGKVYSPLVLAGDILLIGVVEGESILVVIDMDGNEKWDFSPEN